jgi:hypothetical protein
VIVGLETGDLPKGGGGGDNEATLYAADELLTRFSLPIADCIYSGFLFFAFPLISSLFISSHKDLLEPRPTFGLAAFGSRIRQEVVKSAGSPSSAD